MPKHLEIDEVTTDASLSTGTSPTTESITSLNPVEKRKHEHKLDAPSWLLVQPSRLFIIAISLLKQLRTELSDTTANNLIVHLIT